MNIIFRHIVGLHINHHLPVGIAEHQGLDRHCHIVQPVVQQLQGFVHRLLARIKRIVLNFLPGYPVGHHTHGTD
ncbi:hypothetical protein D3C74_429480 [compost metagenome]